jgi:hypothetical protein
VPRKHALSAGSPPSEANNSPRSSWARISALALLAVLPVVLAVAAYYPGLLHGKPLPSLEGDASLYAYQLMRAAECHGQWWQIVKDARLGHPYPTEFAKHPGLFEGVDLMLLAALTAGSLGTRATYHLAVFVALLVNGWIASWIVLRFTRSALWAAMAVILITLNQSVGVRILGHLHLFKFGWILLSIWAFVCFLDRPKGRRGLVLGIAVALVLQASFYLGFFMVLSLGTWFLKEILAGRVKRSHFVPAGVAALAFVILGGALCFPVLTGSSGIAGSSRYFQREWAETWGYGSELWKYFVPKGTWLANSYWRDVRLRAVPPFMDEGWNFPGYTVLLGVLVAGASRLRGGGVYERLGPFVRVGLGLLVLWTILSLAGGPSVLLFAVAPSFRCYGRFGLLVVGVGSVLAPIVLFELVRSSRRRLARAVLTLGVLLLVASDGWRAAHSFPGWAGNEAPPAWVEWLKGQPSDVRLAAFAMPEPNAASIVWWGGRALAWLPLHGHSTLNGGDFALLEGDLRLLGGSYEQINPAGLRFVSSLGYNTLAFHRDYLAANSWIETLQWLDHIDEREEWRFFQTNHDFSRFPVTSLEQIVARGDLEEQPTTEVPPDCWITGSWPVAEDVIVAEPDWALLAWTDDHGRIVTEPKVAFYQHIFGHSIPAYTVRTPRRPGRYRLVVLDRGNHPRAAKTYQIVSNLTVSQPDFPARRPGVTVHTAVLQPADSRADRSPVTVTLHNTSSRYIQSQVFREHLPGVARTHPGLRSQWTGASAGAMVLRFEPADGGALESALSREIPLPEDLPPGGLQNVVIPTDRLPFRWAKTSVQVVPTVAGVGERKVAPARADLKLSVEQWSTEIAGKPSEASAPKR